MRRSYSRPGYFGYEIKVSRADFLQDNKWPEYLPNCNQFFFVTPWKLIMPEEVPDGCGLIWVSKNLTKTYIKKKASHRKIEEPIALLKYILMSRTSVAMERDPGMERIARIRAWLEQEKELDALGYDVARRFQDFVQVQKNENSKLLIELESLKSVKEFWLKELEGDPADLRARYGFLVRRRNEERLYKLKELIPKTLIQELNKAEQLLSHLDNLRPALKAIKEYTPTPLKNNGS